MKDKDQIDTDCDQTVVVVDTPLGQTSELKTNDEISAKMTTTMTSNECSNSEDVCHSMQTDCDQSVPTEDKRFEFGRDSVNNEISSPGISSSSGNKEVIASEDTCCEVIVAANALDALTVSSNCVESDLMAELNGDVNGGDTNGDSSGDNGVSCSSSTFVNQNSQSNEATNVSSNSGLNKKKFGKFRFLNDEQIRGTDNSCEAPVTHSEDTSLDSTKFDDKMVTNESSSHDNSENSDSSKTETSPMKSNSLNKKRGRPAGSTKKEKTCNNINVPQMSLEEEDLNRRRSSRLKTLEARKEQERAVFAQQRDLDDSSQDSNVPSSDANDSLIESSKDSKHKKKKSKKDKNKSKDKNKNSDSKKKKRKKKLSAEDQNKQNCDPHKNEHFATPLPPSHYANIKSNSMYSSFNRNNTEDETSPKPEKVKSRWRRNSELEYGHGINGEKQNAQTVPIIIPKETEPPPPFDAIDENIYLFERKKSKSKKETRRMVCDCILTKEERIRGLIGCGDDCLNRMLMIECGSRCSLGDHCANKRFQKKQYAKVEPFRTARKGWGLRALEPLQPNTFIMEYVGEVVDPLDFHHRTQKYSKEKIEHHYFMALKSDEIIDATVKGNITRFVNHSCDPNSETQKWTVNGDLRIGFFTQRFVQAGEEITFDYQFQRYGKEAQKCFCESMNCRGFIGATESANILTDGSKITATNKLEDDEDDEELLEDLALEEEIAKLAESGGLRNRQQVLILARLMVRAEDIASRIKLINIIKGTVEIAYLRLLLDYHGLQLMWSWMVEAEDNELKAGILEVLEILPIPNKTMLTDSKVYSMVERWAQQTDEEISAKTHTDNDQTVSQSNEVQVSEGNDNKPEDTDDVKLDTKTDQIVSNSTEDEVKQETNKEVKEEPMEVSDEVPTTTQIDDEPKQVEESKQDEELKEDDWVVTKEEETVTKDEDMISEDKEMATKEGEETITKEVEDKDGKEDVKDDIEKEEKNEKESHDKSNKSSPRIEVRSSSLSLVIKPRSVPNTPQKEVQLTQSVVKSKPSIASMAQKLLLNWKELKEVFRIPRLERQKRYEDEKEADRKTKEVEERRARGLPVVFDKRGVDDRDYTIAGILGIKRKGIKRTNDQKDGTVKRTPNPNPLSQSLSSNWNKVSKEEHRKMFEMEVAQKDYQEALKRYHQELAYYNAMYGQQIQAQQQYYSQSTLTTDQQYVYDQYYQSQTYPQSYDNYSNINETQQYLNPEVGEHPTESYEDNLVEEGVIFSTETGPALITLTDGDSAAQSESTLAIDNFPNDCIVYSDSKTTEKLSSNDTIFDPIYPPPGVFYETPDGQKLFVPFPIDGNEKSSNLIFDSNVLLPLEENITKCLTTGKLPQSWSHSSDERNNIYYYHKTQRKSQWNPPEEEKIVSPIVESVSLDIETKIDENEDSMTTSEVNCKSTPSKADEESRPEEPMDSCIEPIDSITADSININTESEVPINSTHSPTNLLQSLLALEADPRKRRHLLNAVMPSTTTAAADTSSSSNRRKLSTRQIQEQFRNKMSEYVVHCLNPYRRPDCKKGRILNNNDFKFLARKLTHTIMGKEIKQCKSVEHLSCNDAVKHKTKDYVKKYMARFGAYYRTDSEKSGSPREHIVANDSND